VVLYYPTEAQDAFFRQMCLTYLEAAPKERERMRRLVSEKGGVLNRLLGLTYQSAKRLRETADPIWLRIGLAAASLENCRFDFRDYLLALAELYVAAEEAGLDPRPEFRKVGRMSSRELPRGGERPASRMIGGMSRSAVLKERRERGKGTAR
jgi:hypothetical protein